MLVRTGTGSVWAIHGVSDGVRWSIPGDPKRNVVIGNTVAEGSACDVKIQRTKVIHDIRERYALSFARRNWSRWRSGRSNEVLSIWSCLSIKWIQTSIRTGWHVMCCYSRVLLTTYESLTLRVVYQRDYDNTTSITEARACCRDHNHSPHHTTIRHIIRLTWVRLTGSVYDLVFLPT